MSNTRSDRKDWLREVLERETRDRLRQELVGDDVGKGLGEAVFGGALLAGAARSGGIEGQSARDVDGENRAQQ